MIDVYDLAAAKLAIQRRRALLPTANRWQADPVGWVHERLGETLWSAQKRIAESVRDNRRTTVHASFDVGKSYCAARLALWWIDTHRPGEAFVVTTAPSYQQVRAILWREMNKAHAKGKLIGRMTQMEWWIGGEMVAFGRKPQDYVAEAFAGIHAANVLVVLDEASGIPATLWDQADGLIANEASRILAIGNPLDPGSRFAEVCKLGSEWNAIGISAFDSPAFTGEEIDPVVLGSLVSKVWVEEKRHDWGEGSAAWVSLVEGRFPEETADSVVLLSWANRCRQDPDDEEIWSVRQPVELGVDVGAGGDETVVYVREGARARMIWHGQTPDSPQATGQVVAAIRETGAWRVKVDVIGIGWGVVGRLEEMREQGIHSAEIVGVNVADAPRDPSKFVKLRDELWWTVGRELTHDLAWDLREADDATIGQLIAPKYSLDSAGRIKVERKEETRKRLGRSPDQADALLLAFYEPNKIMPGETDMIYGIIQCSGPCGRGFVWSPGRRCPYCGTAAPMEYPKLPGSR